MKQQNFTLSLLLIIYCSPLGFKFLELTYVFNIYLFKKIFFINLYYCINEIPILAPISVRTGDLLREKQKVTDAVGAVGAASRAAVGIMNR